MLDPFAPLVLDSNRPPQRFYAGGTRIDEFRGTQPHEPHTPEDWLGSTVAVRGDAPRGLTVVGEEVLADAIATDPVAWLGADHVARYGADPTILVKILDAGQRLPIHVHPDQEFAQRHLGTRHGKTEAWYILTPGTVYLGLREDLDRHRLDDLVRTQNSDELLDAMWSVAVAPGDRVLVPAGTLHAIGEGVLLVEVQEAEDLSILLEWEGFTIDGARHGHLELGFDLALNAATLTRTTKGELTGLVVRSQSASAGLPPAASDFFSLDRLTVHDVGSIPPGMRIVIGLEGELRLGGSLDSGGVRVRQGTAVLMSASVADRTVHGRGVVLVAGPPAPSDAHG